MLALALVFTGCAQEAEAPAATEIVEVTAEPTEEPAPEPTEEPAEELTIVSTVPSVTEILFELGVGENIVGVDGVSNYPDAVMDIEKVGDYNGFDVEKSGSFKSNSSISW